MTSLLLDSVILIDHFNGIIDATGFLERHHAESVLSAITRAEVLTGFDPDDEAPARALLDRFPTLPIDRPAADRAATLRRRHGWRLPDALQAAVALEHGLKLVTRDAGDFPPERHDFVVVPYRLESG